MVTFGMVRLCGASVCLFLNSGTSRLAKSFSDSRNLCRLERASIRLSPWPCRTWRLQAPAFCYNPAHRCGRSFDRREAPSGLLRTSHSAHRQSAADHAGQSPVTRPSPWLQRAMHGGDRPQVERVKKLEMGSRYIVMRGVRVRSAEFTQRVVRSDDASHRPPGGQ